jgi:hypothetical protein
MCVYICSVETINGNRKEFGPYASSFDAERAYVRLIAAAAVAHRADGIVRLVHGSMGEITVVDGQITAMGPKHHETGSDVRDNLFLVADALREMPGFDCACAERSGRSKGDELRSRLSLALDTLSCNQEDDVPSSQCNGAEQALWLDNQSEQVYILRGDQFISFFDQLTNNRRATSHDVQARPISH